MEKPTIYLSSTREMRSQNISLPPKVKKQGYTQNHNLPEKKPTTWNLPWNQCLGREIWTIIDELLEAQRDSVRVKTLERSPQLCEQTLVFYQVVTENMRKIHSGFHQNKGKKLPFWNSLGVLFLKRPTLKRNYFTRA